jgi:cytochrome c556
MKGVIMKAIGRVAILFLITAFAFGAAYAQFAKPEDAIQYRKAVMFLISQHIKRMGAVVQGKAAYDKDEFSADADVVEMLSTLPWKAMMEAGTDKGDTTMISAVFEKEEQFRETAQSFETSAAKLAAAARDGDLKAIKAQFGKTVQYCKTCHTEFRKK